MRRMIALSALVAAIGLTVGHGRAETPARPAGPPVTAARPVPLTPPQRIRPLVGMAHTGQAGVLICVADGRQTIDIRRDYSSGTFGVYVNHSQSMTWLPNRNQVRMRFDRAPTAASAGLAPGSCAFQDRPVAASEPDEVGFPIDPEAWQYGHVGAQPLLMPAGSNVDALLTPGTRTRFTVTLKQDPQLTGSSFWGAEVSPDVVP